MRRRLATALAVGLVACAGFGTGTAAAATLDAYTQAGEWFSPGEGHGSPYDNACALWVQNNFSKGSAALGLITFIDTGGGWNNTVKGTGWLRYAISLANSRSWTKKLHCKNHSSATYQGGCYGFREYQNCA